MGKLHAQLHKTIWTDVPSLDCVLAKPGEMEHPQLEIVHRSAQKEYTMRDCIVHSETDQIRQFVQQAKRMPFR